MGVTIEVLKGPIGKVLKLDKVVGAITPMIGAVKDALPKEGVVASVINSTTSLSTQISSLASGSVEHFLTQTPVISTAVKATTTLLNAASYLSPVNLENLAKFPVSYLADPARTVGSAVGAGVGGALGFGLDGGVGTAVGAYVGSTLGRLSVDACVTALDAAKTYVLVPAVAGAFDGLTGSIGKKT